MLVMVSAFSRFICAVMLPSRTTAGPAGPDVAAAGRSAGRGSTTVVVGQRVGIGPRCWVTDGVAGFCGTLATRLVQCRPYDPESKGVVERANQADRVNGVPESEVPDRAQRRRYGKVQA